MVKQEWLNLCDYKWQMALCYLHVIFDIGQPGVIEISWVSVGVYTHLHIRTQNRLSTSKLRLQLNASHLTSKC